MVMGWTERAAKGTTTRADWGEGEAAVQAAVGGSAPWVTIAPVGRSGMAWAFPGKQSANKVAIRPVAHGCLEKPERQYHLAEETASEGCF